jgi:PERQ amino acid-rich with GYF domain-containing protein
MSPGVGGAVPNSMPVPGVMPKATPIEDPLLLYQYQQYQLLQNQQLFLKQLRASAIGKLSQSEQWANLSPVEQNQLVLQYVRSIDSEIAEMPQPQSSVVPSTFIPTMSQPAPPSNSVLQIFPQLHQVSFVQRELDKLFSHFE